MKAGLTISIIAHAAVLLWSLISLGSKPLEAKPTESLPVDIISANEFSQLVKGNRNAVPAAVPKPLVEKVAEARQPDSPTSKVVEKKPEIIPTSSAPPTPPPAPDRKVPEAKPVPPEAKPEPNPKPEPKHSEPEHREPDPIAEALKREETKKPEPKKEEAKAPMPPRKPEPKPQPKFEPNNIQALLDKRDPQRQAAAGEVINRTPALGTATGNAPQLSQSEIDALRRQIERCWDVPPGAADARDLRVEFNMRLKQDGTLAADPRLLSRGSGPYFQIFAESALRAVRQCQPYNLPAAKYEVWKDVDLEFNLRDMFHG